MSLVEVRGLVSEFRTPSGPIRAVDGVDLSLERGEFLCVVGESGCGKTALALSLLGLMPAGRAAHPAGSIRFDGAEMLNADAGAWRSVRGRRIGLIFQEPMTSLNPVQRIGDQVAEPLIAHGLAGKRSAWLRAEAALAAVGIPSPAAVMRRYPHELSGGMRQRAMIAGATIAEPELLIADEPTTALDVTIAAQILQLLHELQARRNMAVLFVTHDLGVVAQAGDRVLVMYAGQVVEAGSVQRIFAAPAHPYTRGLLDSMPRVGVRAGRLRAIPGVVPGPRDRPRGCRFAPRCPFAAPACSEAPALLRSEFGDAVRCRREHELPPYAAGTAVE